MNKKIIKRIYNVVIILCFIGAIGWCFSHFYHGSDVVYTDDAQVNRHITPINTHVSGFIKEIRFSDYQHVKKGDTLVIIEDSEFRLHVAQERLVCAARRPVLRLYQPAWEPPLPTCRRLRQVSKRHV